MGICDNCRLILKCKRKLTNNTMKYLVGLSICCNLLPDAYCRALPQSFDDFKHLHLEHIEVEKEEKGEDEGDEDLKLYVHGCGLIKNVNKTNSRRPSSYDSFSYNHQDIMDSIDKFDSPLKPFNDKELSPKIEPTIILGSEKK